MTAKLLYHIQYYMHVHVHVCACSTCMYMQLRSSLIFTQHSHEWLWYIRSTLCTSQPDGQENSKIKGGPAPPRVVLLGALRHVTGMLLEHLCASREMIYAVMNNAFVLVRVEYYTTTTRNDNNNHNQKRSTTTTTTLKWPVWSDSFEIQSVHDRPPHKSLIHSTPTRPSPPRIIWHRRSTRVMYFTTYTIVCQNVM